MKLNRPSPEQVEQFDAYIRKWQRLLNLTDWRIEKLAKPARRGIMASVCYDLPARLAAYRIGDWGGDDITDVSLEKTALHELLHVRLQDLIAAARDPHAPEDAVEIAEHSIINVLERLLVDKDDNGIHQ